MMAIKPNDCIVRISDLVVGEVETIDWDGRKKMIPMYERYWHNFCEHLDEQKRKIDWNTARHLSKDPYTAVEDQELSKYGVTFKRTKKWKENYLKFKSHKHLTAFILRWS